MTNFVSNNSNDYVTRYFAEASAQKRPYF